MELFIPVSVILLWIVVLLNLVLTLALIRRVNTKESNELQAMETGPKVGEKAPPFTAVTLEGNTVTLADYVGRLVTFVFVSPNCQPCRELLPTLKTLASSAREEGTELVLICDGPMEETRGMAQQFD